MAFAILIVALPLITAGLLVSDTGGVFSFASLAMRISLTWPDAWQWIWNNEVFPFGVGLGGIGGAQRFYAANFFNPSDNLFVFLYANFGVMGLLYLGWIVTVGRRLPQEEQRVAIAPLAMLAFNLAYGIVAVHAGGPGFGVVHRRLRRNALAIARDGTRRALERSVPGAHSRGLAPSMASIRRDNSWPRSEGALTRSMTNPRTTLPCCVCCWR